MNPSNTPDARRDALKAAVGSLFESWMDREGGDLYVTAHDHRRVKIERDIRDLVEAQVAAAVRSHPAPDQRAGVLEEAAKLADETIAECRRRLCGDEWMGSPFLAGFAKRLRSLASESRAFSPEDSAWKLVPVEPTEGMLDAAVKGSRADVSYADVVELWPAMLNAAPPRALSAPPASSGSNAGRDATVEALRVALEESNSLLAAMLHEKRPDEEIEAQIYDNRTLLNAAEA